MLAAHVAGSETRFITEMNDTAHALGMRHTTYTDPSGLEPSTVSTAADQLRVFQRAMRFAVFRQIVSMASVTLPVAGTLTNYDPLIDEGYAGRPGPTPRREDACGRLFSHLQFHEWRDFSGARPHEEASTPSLSASGCRASSCC